MALHSGIGFSKILVIAGTGYTTTVLFNNHKLSDLLGEKLFSEARERNKISRVKRERASIDNGVLGSPAVPPLSTADSPQSSNAMARTSTILYGAPNAFSLPLTLFVGPPLGSSWWCCS
ncbi:uncharacterized protein LOC115719896 isoform X2 [Cannabis sativa]|uniref:uncharacterized protein LOC115719896 isoform X2 n=1 Tax=Cannabis sativa TaxID=3483 RepID=UPI0029CA7150|nr:uncharacterized protein LOC115719896 isoform X2 [Cannabis sativa]